MLDGIANRNAERKQKHLRNDKEGGAKEDITDGPSVVERAEDEDKLGDDVDGGTDYWPENVYDPQCYGFGVVEAGNLFKCCNGDEKSECKYYQARYPEELGVKK
jgi:hypothetical protein